MTIQLIPLRTSRIQSALAIAIVLTLTACHSKEQASQMTSFSANAAKSATPELFNIPQDQVSHVQVVTVEPGKITRTLRLTGAVGLCVLAALVPGLSSWAGQTPLVLASWLATACISGSPYSP